MPARPRPTRGRPGGADACDAGAVEGVGGPIPTPLTVVVDTAADADDIAPGDGTCADGLGRRPRRGAATETDRWPTDDSITIGTDVDPTLSIFDPPLDFNQHENRNRSGDLDIGDTVTILGDADGTTVDADGVGRVIDHGSGSLHLEGITLTGGDAGQYGTGSGLGESSGAVSLVDSAVDGNLGTFGLDATGGTVSLLRTTVQGNDRRPASSDGGGGVRVADGDLSIVDSAVLANRGPRPAGRVRGRVHRRFAVHRQPHGRHRRREGHAHPRRHLDHRQRGLGFVRWWHQGLRGRSHDARQHGRRQHRHLRRCADGVAVDLTVERSTISDNRSTVAPLYLDHSVTAQISQSTISDNSWRSQRTGDQHQPQRGAPADRLHARREHRRRDLLGFFDHDVGRHDRDAGVGAEPAAWPPSARAVFNLVGDARRASRRRAPTSPAPTRLLGVLGVHGGGTQTQLPGPGSPAIDAIPAGTTGLRDGTFVIDQRGAARPSGSRLRHRRRRGRPRHPGAAEAARAPRRRGDVTRTPCPRAGRAPRAAMPASPWSMAPPRPCHGSHVPA